MPGGIYQHGKLFIGRPCKKRADDLLKLSRHQIKMAVAILTGHAPVRKHLRTMSLFEGDPTCRFCRKEAETVQHVICGWVAVARQRYDVFGHPVCQTKGYQHSLNEEPLPLYKRHKATESVFVMFRVAQ
jgi:hypothetical protein